MAKVDIPKFSNPPRTDDITVLIAYIKELANQTALLSKALDFVVNDGNLDAENIRAKTITANLINVEELSAISANIGEVTAGIIRGISIYGSLISTNETGYPKASMSNTGNFFDVSTNAGDSIRIEEGIFGDPALTVRDGGATTAFLGMTAGALGIQGSVNFVFGTTGNITLNPTGTVYVPSWSQVTNTSTGVTLQQELDTLYALLDGKSNVGHIHSVSVPNHNHGNPDNVTSGGGTFTTSS